MVIGMGALITIAVLAFVGLILLFCGLFTAGIVIAAVGLSVVAAFFAVVADSIASGRWFILVAVVVFGMILYFADKRRKIRRAQQN
jgi:hypothetical protein